MTFADPESDIKTLLTNGWTAANTDSLTPDFQISSDPSESKRVDLVNNSAVIVIYERNRQNIKNSTGKLTKRQAYNLSLKVLCQKSRSHFLKVFGEAERILDANIVDPNANYDILDPTGTYPSKNNSTKGLWVATIDFQLIKSNVTRDA